MTDPLPRPPVPRWLRLWAALTALAALPLVTLGAEVTTRKVGMVDPKGFRAPWHLFTLSGEQLSLGYLIEHGHRLAGFVVGICCIVLALGMTAFARGWLHRSLGFIFSGTIHSVGYKHGRWLDTVIMQRTLGEGDRAAPADEVEPG